VIIKGFCVALELCYECVYLSQNPMKHLFPQAFLLAFSVVSGLLLSSCQPEVVVVYEQTKPLPQQGWHIDSLLSYSFEIQDTSATYGLDYLMENTSAYPYYNLYVTYYLSYNPTAAVLDTQLQNITFMHPKTGEPYGQKQWFRDVYRQDMQALDELRFPAPGQYTLRLKQYMRQDLVPELKMFGIRLYKQPTH
jgi:gliding motility-associated lipoprotein GldH